MPTPPSSNRPWTEPYDEGQIVRLLVDETSGTGGMKKGDFGIIVDVLRQSNGQHGYAVVPNTADFTYVGAFTHAQIAPAESMRPSPSPPPSPRVLASRPVNTLSAPPKAPEET